MKRRTFDFRNDAPMRRSADAAKMGKFNISRLFGKTLAGVLKFLYLCNVK